MFNREEACDDFRWEMIEILASETSDIALRHRLLDRIMRLVQTVSEADSA